MNAVQTHQAPVHPNLSDTESEFEKFLYLLGRLNYTWTNTESLLIHIIAGLLGTEKETAVVVFLTLNTARARLDLVERLAKLPSTDQSEREEILKLTKQFQKLSGLRNLYNHCIYSFDPESGGVSTIQMRVADRKNEIKVGRMSAMDPSSIEAIEASLAQMAELNAEVWQLISRHDYPV